MIKKAVEKGVFGPVYVGPNRVKISHLQFVDDIIFVGEASSKNIIVLKSILRIFELWSGLKINFNKRSLSGINVHDTSLSEWAHSLNCKVTALPFKYLGLKVGANFGSANSWEEVIKKWNPVSSDGITNFSHSVVGLSLLRWS